MSELPECLRTVRSRLRTLFGFSPNSTEKSRKSKDEDLTTPDQRLSQKVCAINERSEETPPSQVDKKPGKKKLKVKSGLFNLKATSGRPKEPPCEDKRSASTRSRTGGSALTNHNINSKYKGSDSPSKLCGEDSTRPLSATRTIDCGMGKGGEKIATVTPIEPEQAPVDAFRVPSDHLLRIIDDAINDTMATPLEVDQKGAINTDSQLPESKPSAKDKSLTHELPSQKASGKMSISSVYIKEINQIKFKRTFHESHRAEQNKAIENGDGDKQSANRISAKDGALRRQSSESPSKGKTPNTSGSKRESFKTKLPVPLKNSEKQPVKEILTRNSPGPNNPPAKTGQRPVKMDRSAQCDLDIYPCTCVIAENGRKVVCPLCVDQPVTPTDKVLTARSRDINSPTKEIVNSRGNGASSKETERKPPNCSSITQTAISSKNPDSPKPTNVQGHRKQKPKPGAPRKETKATPEKPRQSAKTTAPVTTDCPRGNGGQNSREGPKRARQPNSPNIRRGVGEKGHAGEKVKNKAGDSTVGVQGAGAIVVTEVPTTENTQLNNIEKIKNIWKQIKGSKKKTSSDDPGTLLLDLPGDISNAPDPMADLFLAATADDLDRIDGITRDSGRGDTRQETDTGLLTSPPPPNPTPQPANRVPTKEKKTRRLPPKESDCGEKEDEAAKPPMEEADMTDDLQLAHGPDVTTVSVLKRSRSLEELTTNKDFDLPPKSLLDEKVTFEYENPFEISGCIRTDDHYEPGKKAGRGHIPEIRVKQKRRGEPNKHLSAQQRVQQELDDSGGQGDLDLSGNPGGDPGSLVQDPDLSGREPDGCMDISWAEDNDQSPIVKEAEVVEPSEIVPDMRHCQKIPLEVIYGKKGSGTPEEEEYMPSSVKKKKGRQRPRDRGRPPPLLGINFY